MKQAKWLLLIAVGIMMVLPGCKKLGPAVSQDANIAAAGTQTLATYPLLANNQPQTQIGICTFYWQWDDIDPTLPKGDNGNGQYVNLMFGVKYETYSPGYPIKDAHLNISVDMPTGRGSPGLYNCNKYLQTPYPDDFTRIFLIPEGVLTGAPWYWICGGSLWFKCHVAIVDGPTAMVGEFVDVNPWFNRLQLAIKNPDGGGDGEYRDETAWGYDIYDPDVYFTNVPKVAKWGGVVEYTLGTPTTVDLWAGAGQNDPLKGTIVGSVTVTDDGGNVYVHYVLTGGCLAYEAHAGADINLAALSKKSNKFAPGQLGVTEYYNPWDDDFMLTIPYESKWGSSFVVAAHAKVIIPVE